MLDLVTTALECVGFALVIAAAGMVTAVLVGGALGVGVGCAAAGGTALVLSALAQAAAARIGRDGRRTR